MKFELRMTNGHFNSQRSMVIVKLNDYLKMKSII